MAVSSEHMTLLVNLPPSAPPHMYAAAAEQCLQWGRPDGALEVSQLGLERHPNYTGLRLFRAEAYLLGESPALAEGDLRAVLAAEPQHPRALKALSELLVAQKRWPEAIPVLDRAEFVLVDDPQIGDWMRQAEAGALEAVAEPAPMSRPDSPVPEKSDPRDIEALLAVQGVVGVCLAPDGEEPRCETASDGIRSALASLAGLAGPTAGVLQSVGFGRLKAITVESADHSWIHRCAEGASVSVAAERGVREGLIAWHVSRMLRGEPGC